MDRVKIALVGFGAMGSAHAHSIYNGFVKGMELVAICDIDRDKREKAKELYPEVEVFEKYDDLIDSGIAEAILIATPHYLHPVVGIAALQKGLNVLTEKPLAVSCTDARRFIDVASKSGKVFAVMFQWRMHPLFKKAREIIKGGEIGEIRRLVWIVTNWYRNQAYYDSGSWRATWKGEGGGVLLNQAPHNLDQIQWLVGIPCRLYAECEVGRYHDISVEDDATVIGEFTNGAKLSFITTTGEYPGTNRLEISGSKGKLVMEDNTLRIYRLQKDEEIYRRTSAKDSPKPKYTVETFSGSETEDRLHGMILENFASAILNGEELVSPGASGIGELEISNGAYLSSWLGRSISLPIDASRFDFLLAKKRKEERAVEKIPEKSEPSLGYARKWFVNW